MCCITEFLSISVIFIAYWFYVEEESRSPTKINLWNGRGTTLETISKLWHSMALPLPSQVPGKADGEKAQAFSHLLGDRFSRHVRLSLACLIFISSLLLPISEPTTSETDILRFQESWGILRTAWENSSKGPCLF